MSTKQLNEQTNHTSIYEVPFSKIHLEKLIKILYGFKKLLDISRDSEADTKFIHNIEQEGMFSLCCNVYNAYIAKLVLWYVNKYHGNMANLYLYAIKRS